MCGFSMFDQVRCDGHGPDAPKGQIGNIVGFSPNLVDVQLKHGTFKFSPEEIELLSLKNKLGLKQEAVDTASKSPPVAQPAPSSVWAHRHVHVNGAKVACPRDQKATPLEGACNRPAGVKSQRGAESAATKKASSAALSAPRADHRIGPRSVQAASTDAGAALPETPLDSTLYDGWVTWSRGSMAWLCCEALASTYPLRSVGRGPGCNVFLHRNDCTVMPKQYARVSFRLTLDASGNPKAIQATVEAPKSPKKK